MTEEKDLTIAQRRIGPMGYDQPRLSFVVQGHLMGKWIYYADDGNPSYVGTLEQCLKELQRDQQMG